MSQLKRIIFHWTAGSYTPSIVDKKSYHFLVDGNGNIHQGNYKPEDNIITSDGKYAAHTLNANTGSIGISVCCMGGKEVKERPLNVGKYPLKHEQWNALIKKIADLCLQYDIVPSPTTVLSHAEVEKNLGIKQKGKWDITLLPGDTIKVRPAKEVGDALRKAVAEEIKTRKTTNVVVVAKPETTVVEAPPVPVVPPVSVVEAKPVIISGSGNNYWQNLIKAIFGIK